MSLKETKTQLFEVRGTGQSWLALVYSLYIKEINSDEKFLTMALSELHNSGEIDVVQLLSGVKKISVDYDFFTLLHVLGDVLPTVTASVEDTLNCLVYLMRQAGRDLAINGIYGAFQRYCGLDSERPEKSIKFILGQNDLDAYTPFISSSLLAMHSDNANAAIQTAKDLISHENVALRNQIYFTLGKLDVDDPKTLWELLITNANAEQDNTCSASLQRALLNHGNKFPSYWQPIEELFNTSFHSVSSEAQYEISRMVAFQQAPLPENILKLLIKKLTNTSPEHKGIINNIDHCLVKLVEQNSSGLAIELLESIIIKGITLPSLHYFLRKLRTKFTELQSQLITKWFLSGEPSLCNGVLDLLQDATNNDIELCADMSILDDEKKQIFVCCKAIGWLFTKPVSATRFLISVYESGSISIQKDIQQLLYNPLLLSYPEEVKKYLQTNIEKKIQTELCEHLLGELERHHKNLEQVASLRELRAPSENINSYWKDFDRSMQEAQDEGPKSIFEDICTVQNLLYGNSSIYYMNDINGDQKRQEMEMQIFSHSSEIPRLNIVDPENLNYMLLVFRIERMKNEANS
jgi:hypothetical protein